VKHCWEGAFDSFLELRLGKVPFARSLLLVGVGIGRLPPVAFVGAGYGEVRVGLPDLGETGVGAAGDEELCDFVRNSGGLELCGDGEEGPGCEGWFDGG
jgi:hypothetical protein